MGKYFSPFSKMLRTAVMLTQASCSQWMQGAGSRPHIEMPKLRIRGGTTPFPPYSVMVWCRTTDTIDLDTDQSIAVSTLQVATITHKNKYSELLFSYFVPFGKMSLFRQHWRSYPKRWVLKLSSEGARFATEFSHSLIWLRNSLVFLISSTQIPG